MGIVGLMLSGIVPGGLLLVVYSAIKGNNRSLIQGICWLNGACSCCTLCNIAFLVMTLMTYAAYSDQVDKSECTEDGYKNSAGELKKPNDYNQTDCQSALDAMNELYSVG